MLFASDLLVRGECSGNALLSLVKHLICFHGNIHLSDLNPYLLLSITLFRSLPLRFRISFSISFLSRILPYYPLISFPFCLALISNFISPLATLVSLAQFLSAFPTSSPRLSQISPFLLLYLPSTTSFLNSISFYFGISIFMFLAFLLPESYSFSTILHFFISNFSSPISSTLLSPSFSFFFFSFFLLDLTLLKFSLSISHVLIRSFRLFGFHPLSISLSLSCFFSLCFLHFSLSYESLIPHSVYLFSLLPV